MTQINFLTDPVYSRTCDPVPGQLWTKGWRLIYHEAVTGMHVLWWQALYIIEDSPFVQVPNMLIGNL